MTGSGGGEAELYPNIPDSSDKWAPASCLATSCRHGVTWGGGVRESVKEYVDSH